VIAFSAAMHGERQARFHAISLQVTPPEQQSPPFFAAPAAASTPERETGRRSAIARYHRLPAHHARPFAARLIDTVAVTMLRALSPRRAICRAPPRRMSVFTTTELC
jgi:hypothetical protein